MWYVGFRAVRLCVATRDEAEALVARFEGEAFPKLVSSSITEHEGAFEVEAVKEFGARLRACASGRS